MNDKDRQQQLEELRFAKRQQWSVATLAVTLLAAIFAIAHGTHLTNYEKDIATAFAVVIGACSFYLLIRLQDHLEDVRKVLNQNDKKAWARGVDVLFVLCGAVAISVAVVIWYIWFSTPA